MIGEMIARFFEWFSVIMLALGVVAAVACYAFRAGHRRRGLAEELFRWIALTTGVVGVVTFVIHAFYPDKSAAMIGWEPSPFQFEVAMADLSFGVLCLVAFAADKSFRLATVIATSICLWGDAVGHVRQMVVAHNFMPGNAGPWFWTDVIVPALLLVLWLGAYVCHGRSACTLTKHESLVGASR